MATREDYFAPIYNGDSIAGILAQDDINELSMAFDRFLSDIRCKRTPNSEWYYSSPHSGIHASWDAWELIYWDPEEVEWPGELITMSVYDAWNERVPRMRALKEWIDKHERHLDNADWHWSCGYVKRKHNVFSKRWDIMLEAFEDEIEAALEDVCDEYEKLLEDACDYRYSDEAADDWVEVQNDFEEEFELA